MTDLVPVGRRRRVELEEERDFLLASLADLDRERDAGDIDVDDYVALRDEYTARAAAAIRELDEGVQPAPGGRRIRWKSVVGASAVTVVLFLIVWWALSASSAQRLPDQSITGADPRSERQQMLSQAYAVQMQQPERAAVIYGMVLQDYPDDVEAMTYGGWTRALAAVRSGTGDSDATAAELTTAAEMLTKAIDLDPSYPDPRCLRGVLFGRFLQRNDLAAPDLDKCLELNPPADMRALIEGLRDQVSATTAPG